MSKQIKTLQQIVHKYSTFFFDLDGVIWKGPEKIKGGVEALNFLRKENKRIFFITNSSVRNKQMLKDRFQSFGFQAQLNEIFPASFIASLYIKENFPNARKILVFGEKCLAEDIKAAGKPVWHYNDPTMIKQMPEVINLIDKEVDVVLFGYDFQVNYTKMCLASFHVQKGATLVGTNPDKFTMISGFKTPGNGSILSCVEQASGVKAIITGKPNKFILNYLIEECNVNKEECLMIGYNLQTDIEFGQNCGIDTLCVLGNSTEKDVLESNTATYYSQFLL